MSLILDTNKYFIYCRKSSEQEDRQILSLDSQENELRKLAIDLKLKVIDVYKESGSAHVIGRKGFNDMLTRFENNEAQGLIVWDESRIARNSLDGGKVIYMMDLKQIVEIHKPGKVYKNTPDDKSWLNFIFTMSKKESDDKSVNVKRGLKTKAEKGRLPSGAKAGYMNDKFAEKGNKRILKDPVRYPLIRKAWDLMLTGTYGPLQILRTLNDEWGYRTPIQKRQGGKPMSRSQIYKTFTDPYYYGWYEYPLKSGDWYQVDHKAMITEDEFNRVQILLGNKGRPRPKTHTFNYTGLVQCGECSAAITAEEKHQIICSNCKLKFASSNKTACPRCQILITSMENPTRLHYIYYHCTKRKVKTCSQKGIRVEKFEQQCDALLENIQISEGFKNWAIKHLNEVAKIETNDRNSIIQSQQKAYDDCVKRIDNLVKLKISSQNSNSELLSDDEFKNQKESLLAEKSKLMEKLQDTDGRIDKWVELTERTFNFACYARSWFANGNIETKKQILLGIGSNLTLKDGIVGVDLEKPLRFIEIAKNEVVEISPLFEPEKEGYESGQIESFYSKNLSLLPLVNAFKNREIEFGFSLQNIQTVFETFQIQPAYSN